MDSNSWVRFAIFALILISFLRRVLRAKAQSRSPSRPAPTGLSSNTQAKLPSTAQSEFPATIQSKFPTVITPTMARQRSGQKNDFRNVPPPPENPDLG